MKQPCDKIICESCGEEFSCGASIGECWCFDVGLKADTSVKLREDFNGCLCSNCLVKFDYGKFDFKE